MPERGVGVTGETPNPLDVLREVRTFAWSRPSHYPDDKIALVDAALAQVADLVEALEDIHRTTDDLRSRLTARAALVPFPARENTNG